MARAVLSGLLQYLTKLNYTQHIRNHTRHSLMKRKLQELSGADIQRFYNQLLLEESGNRLHDEGGRPLKKDGKPIMDQLFSLTRLEKAMKPGYIRTNPADSCELSRVEKEDIVFLMEALQGNPYLHDAFTSR